MNENTMNENTNECVLLCVTGHPSAVTLCNAAQELSKQTNARLEILCILPPLDKENPDLQKLETLDRLAQTSGTVVNIYFNESPVLVAAAFAKKVKATRVALGFSERQIPTFANFLRQLLPQVPFAMIGKDGALYQMIPANRTLITGVRNG
ncbi:MAG: hypothetical protein LBB67_06200 [Oscillospiraceae bacterium]|jgi:K+-sensing histidine kinase KdpD|nr:hypothetical protein [Oscillospiraceae bacterium]